MSSEEKAKELIEKFQQHCGDFRTGNLSSTDHAKACALICVEEITDELANCNDVLVSAERMDFWQSVKEHINQTKMSKPEEKQKQSLKETFSQLRRLTGRLGQESGYSIATEAIASYKGGEDLEQQLRNKDKEIGLLRAIIEQRDSDLKMIAGKVDALHAKALGSI